MPLTVLGNVVKVVPANDNRAGHFGRHDLSGQDASTDRDVTSEWALFVCILRELKVDMNCPKDAPMYVPLIASEGVLNPRPTSLYHRFSFVETFLPPGSHSSTQAIPMSPPISRYAL